MGIFSPPATDTRRDQIAEELAGLRAEVKALRTERDRTAELNALSEQIEQLKVEKGRLVEDNDRKIRETEHKVGLLKTKQDHDVANAKRETELTVREENLAADKTRFKDEMAFQRTHLQGEVDRIDGILRAILERLPTIEVEVGGNASTSRSRKGD